MKMNLLNLILIVLIITIEPFIRFIITNGLVFIKPENLTKTELLAKFKELSSSKSLEDLKNIKNNEDKKDEDEKDKITIKDFLKSYYLRLTDIIFKLKKLISKIVLFTILIKYFRKIKIMRFIIRIMNYIFLSTFGILITDIYGLKEIITLIEYYWMGYVNFIHESKIYQTLVKIFHVIKESDVNSENEIKSKIESNPKINQVKSENSEIIVNKESYDFPSSDQKFKKEKTWDVENNWGDSKNIEVDKAPFYKNTYFLIGLSIISLGLIYIYWDSINELFKNVKPSDSSDINPSNSSSGSNTPIYKDPHDEYREYFRELETNQELYDLDVIKSLNKGKTIDYSDVENSKWEDSPTTPKPSSSKLPDTDKIIVPFPKI
jgi:hypothetical protein